MGTSKRSELACDRSATGQDQYQDAVIDIGSELLGVDLEKSTTPSNPKE
ncbi:hypothetical protein [Candidatus Brachybacter algidus]|nr:hypothetical protein [Candidatus Brachybacter algidus]MBK6450292.1 hypothetical protein [Candidatus Brachybacter algidus]